ncbi:ABC transporter permease, partial [Methanoregula sp.]
MPVMLRGALAIFKRDFKKFLSNPFIIMMTLIMPIMYLVIFGSAMGGTLTHIPVGVVQEVPPYNDTPLFTSAAYQLNHISQTDFANKLLDVTVYADENVAKQDLDNGKLSAVIVFPSSVSNDNAVRVYVDSSDSVTPPIIEAAVNQV